ncbi:t-lymphoma invasion and metastasis-inducing protein 2 [Limosa lapponica baueri]|uniref:T-lymphoma invasion and metastasis-inducing protein 2 n=1 Tax=Limosa lapponica baueri TaxID=1758121 RepID=A0A2I0U4Z7_LIMLA|nr:t-lymphoma invasion and metastasis-inducing protein 2 [Limosa lapponica baueri]
MKQLEPRHYGLQLRRLVDENTEYCAPEPYEYIVDQESVYDEIEICPLNVYHIHLTKTENISDFGFAVTAQVDENQHLTRIFVSDVLPDGLAYKEGLRVGNEILSINGEAVSDLDLRKMELLFSERSVMLSLRMNHYGTQQPLCASWSDGDISRDPKTLLPPPNQSQLLEEFLDNFKKNTANDFSNVPDVTSGLKRSSTDGTLDQLPHREKTDPPFRTAQPVVSPATAAGSSSVELWPDPCCHRAPFEKDISDTSKTVACERSSAEQISALCRNFQEVQASGMEGQKDNQDPPPRPLARHLSDADRLRKVIQELMDTEKSYVKKLLFSLGGSFLYYADHFKLYSGFCANHIKVQKVLEREALKAMEKVASHINEMQKIYEDYGTVFDQLVADQSGTEKEVTELSMGELLMHSTVSWLNPFPSLGKARKDLELTVFVFKRAVILVYKENYKLKKKMPTNARAAHNYGDLDPFKFRWLIPLSALQVRLGNTAGTENSCVWELIHTKSELEGRPETIFQLCSR